MAYATPFHIPALYDALDVVMRYYPNRFTEEAKIEIETLLDHCLSGLEEDSEMFLVTLFIKALKRFVGPTGIDEHIYLKKYNLPQIELFDILIKKFPFVKLSHQLVNEVLAKKVQEKGTVTLIDIGIGRGIQVMSLIEQLRDVPQVKKLSILGLEPHAEALAFAEKHINELAKTVPFEVEFMPWNTLFEQVSEDEFVERANSLQGEIIVNESLTLHHIQQLADRRKVLAYIKRLNPVMFLLTEPNVDHFEPDFYKRFQNCYQHFYHVFQIIDRLDIDTNAKNSLKLFFGREIEDIIGSRDSERYEKHEPAFRWIEKLKDQGFKITKEFCEVPQNTEGLNIRFHPEGHLGFTHKQETVLAIICARA